MSRRHALIISALLAMSGDAFATTEAPLAIVVSVEGTATVLSRSVKADVQAFDWLVDGDEINISKSAKLDLIFADGRRYIVRGPTVFAVTASSIPASANVTAVQRFSPMPQLPKFDRSVAALRAAAVRIRGGRLAAVYPHRNARTLPEETVLHFHSTEPLASLSTRVTDDQGRTVYSATSDTPAQLAVPSGLLRHGRDYRWVTKAETTTGTVMWDVSFVTVGKEDAERRERWIQSLEVGLKKATQDELIVAVDRHLGLLTNRTQIDPPVSHAFNDPALVLPFDIVVGRQVSEDRVAPVNSADAESPILTVQLGHTAGVAGVAASSDGAFVVTGGSDRTASMWNLTTGRLLRRLAGHTATVGAVSISPDSRMVLTTSADMTARLWDAATGRQLHILTGHTAPVLTGKFSHSGRLVATGSSDSTARIWEVASGKLLTTIGGKGRITALAFSSDDEELVFGDSDSICRWNLSRRDCLSDVKIQYDDVANSIRPVVAVSADGELALVQSRLREAVCRVVQTRTGEPLRHFMAKSMFIDAAFSNGPTVIAIEMFDRSLSVVDLRSPEATPKHIVQPAIATSVATVGGTSTVILGFLDGTAKLIDFISGAEIRRYEGDASFAWSVRFSPNGQKLVVGNRDSGAVWDLVLGRQTYVAAAAKDEMRAVMFSRDGSRLAIADRMKQVTILDLVGKTRNQVLEGHSERVTSMAFSPANGAIATASGDSTVRIWSPESSNAGLVLSGHGGPVNSVVYTGEGDMILTGSSDRTARLWDAATGLHLRTFTGHTEAIFGADVTPDGRRVITASIDKTVRVWDASDGSQLRTLEGHDRPIMAVRAFPDGQRVVSASEDGTARVWDISTGTCSVILRGHTDIVTAVDVSPDSKVIVTSSKDGSVRLWQSSDGRELCRLYSFPEKHWAAVDPHGRFDTDTPDDVRLLHWVLPQEPMQAVPIELFLRDYFETGLLAKIIGGEPVATVKPIQNLNRVRPVVRIDDVQISSQRTATVKVSVTAAADSDGPGDRRIFGLRLLRDGQVIRLWPSEGGEIESDGRGQKSIVFREIALPSGTDVVTFSSYAFNNDRIKTNTAVRRVVVPLSMRPERRAYLVSVGIDRFDGAAPLGYAASDATRLAAEIGNGLRASGVFHETVQVSLTSANSNSLTKAMVRAVLRALAGEKIPSEMSDRLPREVQRIRASGPDDLVLISFSTHGEIDANGLFALRMAAGDAITSDDLTSWLLDTEAHHVGLLIDACYAGGLIGRGFKPGPHGDRNLGQIAWDKRAALLLSTQADNVAIESDLLHSGLLAYAVIDDGLLSRRADAHPADGKITLSELLRYGASRTSALFQEILAGADTSLVVRIRRRGGDGGIAAALQQDQTATLYDFSRGLETIALTR